MSRGLAGAPWQELEHYGRAMAMDLLQWVAQRIDQDATLTEEAGLLVLASLQAIRTSRRSPGTHRADSCRRTS